ncbi:hypothetical protein ACM43_31440 [Bradyrhizobium sp. CCBAU 45321]|uniref:DUF1236 domain-containing protein n=1 Tax=Bradyrhizobium sp. CCBAU 45321 TaxID=1641878 RepID=UPI0023021133|nr:DUF1236 domain-containing protein [Bradyrhizobium sp. CCBAU 45321]MDA9548889.1 hypothetical protein [Bradyrhizobium sp. CCBAU 45321]
MIRLLATTALGVVLASAAYAQSPSTNSPSQQTTQSQSNSTAPSTTSPSSATDTQQTTSQPQQSPPSGTSTQTTQTNPPSSGSGTANTGSTAQSQSGTANSNAAGNQPATQQSANPPPANTNQAQDRSNPPPASNQAQQAPAASGTNQAQQAPTAPTSNQAAAQTDVNLNKQQETKISASISHLNVRPLTNVNFSLNVGTVVPRDVHLSTLPPDVVEIVPQYRGYSFALVKDQIVVVDPATYKIVTVLPYSGQSTATTTTTRERSASKFSDRDREVIRKHAKTRTEGRKEVRTTGSTARSEIRVGDRLPESVEVEEFPTTVYRDAPGLREYRYIHRDTRTYVIEPRERRVIEEID